jgi:Zn ribbon nucleic-acid-binding protein
MKEQLINCPRCNSNACSEMSDDKIIIWQCLGCGFTSNTFLNEENSVKYKEVLPELYKDLEFIDEKGLRWYPTSVVMDDKSMIFAEGTSTSDWKWAAVQSKDGKPDMTTKKEFNETDFMEALDYVGYFKKPQE